MPTYNFTLTSWSDNAGVGTKAWSNPGNAQVLDTEVAGVSFVTVGATISHYLLGVNPNSIPSWGAGEVLSSITVDSVRRCDSNANVTDYELCLVHSGIVLTAVNLASATIWPVTLTSQGYTFTSADLATLGITTAQIDSSFGIALACTSPGASLNGSVDQISGVFNTSIMTAAEATNPSNYLPGIGIANL
jgi:hypothetical protein